MRRLLLALLATHSLAHAGVILVDEAGPKKPAVSASATPAGQTATATAPTPRPVPKWQIEKGQPIHQALEAWAKEANWTLIWYPSVSWKAIGPVDMQHKKDVVDAVSEIVNVLRAEGKPVRLRVSDGNNVMEVVSTEVKND